MKKVINKILSTVLMFSMISSVIHVTVQAEEAIPTASTVLVNGKDVKFDAYNIEGNNYFKLRDLAYVLNATEKQFSVGYNQVLNTISLTSRQPYTPVGGELAIGTADIAQATPTASTVMKDGAQKQLQAYLINDNNYFKLRDIGELFNFSVTWNGETNTISISTSENYEPEKGTDNMNNDTYYKDYKPGDKIQLSGVINKIEEFRGTNKRSKDFVITAVFTDDNGAKWVIPIHVQTSYGLGYKSDYEPYIGKQVAISGTYEGYSKWYDLPCVSMYELVDKTTNKTEIGIRKAEELVNNGKDANPSEPFINDDVTAKGVIEKWMSTIQCDMIEDILSASPNHKD
jgi:hypothetical protein